MARPLRIEYPGAFYHVSASGFGDQNAFLNDADYGSFLHFLADTCDKTGWRVHAYCLAPGKYHLFIETPEPNLVSGMTWLQNSYTMDHNHRRGRRSGAVFGDRYRSVPVEVDQEEQGGGFYRAMLDFIHLKPVRSGLIQPTDDLRAYRFSSLSFYDVAIGMRGSWQHAALGLAAFGFTDSAVGRNQFVDRLHELRRLEPTETLGLKPVEGQSQHSSLRRGWYFGSLAFRDELKRMQEKGFSPATAEDEDGDELARQILHFGLPKLQMREDQLPGIPKSDWRKTLLAHLLTRHTTVTLAWVADHLHMGSRSGVCRGAHRFAEGLATHPERQRDAERILAWARAELSA